jgi:predicted ATPase/class 3 adenylate cyclase
LTAPYSGRAKAAPDTAKEQALEPVSTSMRGPPSGTVTFLFTDVEGSTRLLGELGAERYSAALAEHRRVLRAAAARHGGVEVDTVGDAFFVAFPTALGALACAAEATQALAAGPIRVRMGLHTGTALVTEEGYVGLDVHRAARIAAAGHGGQVLISSSTAALIEPGSRQLEWALHDLGEHRFKDLTAPERVYQLGDQPFPPLRSLYRTNLPVPATPFLGRERELAKVVDLLARDDVRLVTLTGPGGIGKTRLALQAAAEASERFPDGVYWVQLSPLRDAGLVLPTIAQALDLTEQPGRSLVQTLVAVLARKRIVLLVDNAEHLLPEVAGELAALLAVDGPTLLVTSRERLQLRAEHLYPVPALEERDAVALFVTRAAALDVSVGPSAAVAHLCERLDELPLALELAAARTPLFSVEQLLDRVGQRLDLLKGGRDSDPRQRTLRTTIEWSHDLLSPSEQALFRRLCVFVGGCSYDAAEGVCGADPDTLQSLIDKSLLRRRDVEFGSRYWMLETIREYAVERLDASGEADRLRGDHAAHFLAFAEAANALEQPSFYLILDAEHANLRAAMAWLREKGETERELRLAAALHWFWRVRGPVGEGQMWLEHALGLTSDRSPARVRALAALADLLSMEGKPEAGLAHGRQAVALARELGDIELQAESLHWLGNAASGSGNLAQASDWYQESAELSRGLGHTSFLIVTLTNLAQTHLDADDVAAARAGLEESLALAREIGNPQRLSQGLLVLAQVETREGRFDEARQALRESLTLARELGLANFLAWGLGLAAPLTTASGRPDRTVRLLAASVAQEELLGIVQDLLEAPIREQNLRAARAAIGSERFDAAYGEGGAMTLDEAVTYALDSLA